MLDKEDILSYLREKKGVFFSDYQVIEIGLFGSFARGEALEDSDIDLIVEFSPSTEALAEKKAKIKSIIERKFNRNVDLCREKYLKPYFKTQILASVIYV